MDNNNDGPSEYDKQAANAFFQLAIILATIASFLIVASGLYLNLAFSSFVQSMVFNQTNISKQLNDLANQSDGFSIGLFKFGIFIALVAIMGWWIGYSKVKRKKVEKESARSPQDI